MAVADLQIDVPTAAIVEDGVAEVRGRNALVAESGPAGGAVATDEIAARNTRIGIPVRKRMENIGVAEAGAGGGATRGKLGVSRTTVARVLIVVEVGTGVSNPAIVAVPVPAIVPAHIPSHGILPLQENLTKKRQAKKVTTPTRAKSCIFLGLETC